MLKTRIERKNMRHKIYHFLVNRHPEIARRYHRCHDNATGFKLVISWFYLLWMNIMIHMPGHFLLKPDRRDAVYEEKHLPTEKSESVLAGEELLKPEELAALLAQYDTISFDIFDTLLFRPFSSPTDLFFFVGERLAFLDFKHIRIKLEQETRTDCLKREGHTEICLREIWQKAEQETGIPAETGIEAELQQEEAFCYGNTYMLTVFQILKKQGKQIIAVSDMYLPKEFLQKLLKKHGFEGLDRIYVSCEYGKSKASGGLYELVRQELPKGNSVIHVGDNQISDVKNAKAHGFASYYYPNADRKTADYRAEDMSPLIGGAYRGIVNHYLYNGMHSCSMEYEYGFIYGGLFVLGYCSFIHDYCLANDIDKVLFLSRDGDILKQVYNVLYPHENTEYVYWSRAAAAKLTAEYNKYDYFRRFLYHKVNQGKCIQQILTAMDLATLLKSLPVELQESDLLSDKNVKVLKTYLERNWCTINAVYEPQQTAAKMYYEKVLKGCKKVCAVDIGWAGSGALALSGLVENKWELHCKVTGLIAGTNTPHNEEPEASETFLQTGKLVSYLYSSAHNRDLWKKHDPNRNDNLYWELLLSSPTRQFLGFDLEPDTGEIKLCFGRTEENQEGIYEIQKGILDFVREYQIHFANRPEMFRISGRDAYAPMITAGSFEEKYLKKIYEKFGLSVQVGE